VAPGAARLTRRVWSRRARWWTAPAAGD
jgi:hypothetical protein